MRKGAGRHSVEIADRPVGDRIVALEAHPGLGVAEVLVRFVLRRETDARRDRHADAACDLVELLLRDDLPRRAALGEVGCLVVSDVEEIELAARVEVVSELYGVDAEADLVELRDDEVLEIERRDLVGDDDAVGLSPRDLLASDREVGLAESKRAYPSRIRARTGGRRRTRHVVPRRLEAQVHHPRVGLRACVDELAVVDDRVRLAARRTAAPTCT
jgi:hypothetical protein